MAKIENHKYSIEEAFRECFYIIPDYQREYVWTEKEVRQLLDDIDEQLGGGEENREYFIGMVLVSPTTPKNHFEVIDGQQRLTTFFLLLCALRNLFRGEAHSATMSGLIATSYTSKAGDICTSLKLDPRYDNAGEAMGYIAANETNPDAVRSAIQSAGIASFGSLENLLNAYATIHSYLSEHYKEKADLRRYWGYLANNVVFIQISADVGSALKIFETINERGIGLSPMDLLKNLLFTHVRAEQFAKLKDEWKKITSPLEKAEEKPLRFLRYFLMANYRIQNVRNDAVVREDEIYDWLTDRANAEVCAYADKPFEFVRKIARQVELYLGFAKGFGNDGKPNVAMDNLKRLAGGAFSLHYVLLLAAGSFPKHLFDHFVRQLESFLFFYIFTKTATKELERSFSIWADELRGISAIADPDQQRDALNTFLANRFQASMTEKEGELTDALKRYTLGSMQKYRTHYLLSKLSQVADMAYQGVKTAGSLNDYKGLEIEHILPNNPRPELRSEFSKQSPGADYEDHKNRLGNLTLLEKPINIVAGNDFFKQKKVEYAKSRVYLTSSIAGLVNVGKNSSITRINAKLLAFEQWTVASIDARQEMLIKLGKEVWKVVPVEGTQSTKGAEVVC